MFSEWGCAKGRRFSYHGDNKVFLDPGGPWYEKFFEVSIGNGTVVAMYSMGLFNGCRTSNGDESVMSPQGHFYSI